MPTTLDSRFPEATTEGTVRFGEHETWYRITGDLRSAKTPLVVLHGGPGCGHNYCLMMANLARDGRAVIHYDQIGCGSSTHLPDAPESFWRVQLFIDELRNLVRELGIERFHLLGQSWGGMLAPEVVLDDADGIASMTICDSPASMKLWLEAAAELRAQLPAEVQATLLAHENAGTTDSAEYEAAMEVFYNRHVCRVVPNPPEVRDTFTQLAAEPTVYHTMNGPSEFHVVGTMKDWSIVDRLSAIAVPTLVISGEYDEAAATTWEPFISLIPGARSHVFGESSHMPHVEQPEEFLDVVGAFLAAND